MLLRWLCIKAAGYWGFKMMQTVIAIMIGAAALFYVIKIIVRQFSKVETDPKCDNCPVPDLKNTKR